MIFSLFKTKPCLKCQLLTEQVSFWKERANEAHEREKAAVNGYLMMQEKPVIVERRPITEEEAQKAREHQEMTLEDVQALFRDQGHNPAERLTEV